MGRMSTLRCKKKTTITRIPVSRRKSFSTSTCLDDTDDFSRIEAFVCAYPYTSHSYGTMLILARLKAMGTGH